MATVSPVASGHHRHVHREYHVPFEDVFARIVNYVVGVIIAFLALRFVLLLFGANAAAAFTKTIYSISDVLMAPFAAIFKVEKVEGAVFDWSALLAMAVYALIGWGLVSLVRAVSPRQSVTDMEQTEKSERHEGEAD